jgi:hypothetical protein
MIRLRVMTGAVAVLCAAIMISGCAGESAPNSDAAGSAPPTYIDANAIDIAGTWEGEASILTVDSGAMRSFGRYEITAPIDGVFTVRETLNLEKPSELEEGAPLATTRQQDLLGVISPDGSIRMVKITDEQFLQGWFTDEDTLQVVFTETGAHAVVGARTASRVGS